MERFITWLPLIVVFISGFFALYQIRSNNITNARIKWLENLKQLFTEFLSESMLIQLKEGATKGIVEINQNSEVNQKLISFHDRLTESFLEHLKNIESKYNLIILNLNPKEELHKKIEKLLEDYMVSFNKIPIQSNVEDYNLLLRKLNIKADKIIILTRYIIKLEWEKTKRSKISKFFYMKFGKGKKILNEANNL